MVEFTFFELHVDDVEFGDAPFARSAGSARTEPTADEADRDDEEGGSGLASKLFGLLVVAAAVYAARRFLGGGGDEEPAFASEESAEPLAAD